MHKIEIKSILTKKLNLTEVYVTGDNHHIKIIAIGDIFQNMTPVKRQQIVYAPLTNMILKKYVHAISITSYTSEEWKNKKTINNVNDS